MAEKNSSVKIVFSSDATQVTKDLRVMGESSEQFSTKLVAVAKNAKSLDSSFAQAAKGFDAYGSKSNKYLTSLENQLANASMSAKDLAIQTAKLNSMKFGGSSADVAKAGELAAKIYDVKNASKEAAQESDNLANALKHVAHYGVGLIGIGMIQGVASSVITTTAEFQRLEAALVTVKGSTQAAEIAFDQIKDFAKTTPYELAEVTDAFIKMEALGLTASSEAMTAYGDTASGLGKSLNQMIEAVADASVGEFERLKEFGIKASSEGDKVKFTFKGITTEVGKNAKEIEEYLIGLGQANFAGGMERQMQTIGGQLSNLQDNWSSAFNAIGTAAMPVITTTISGLNSASDAVRFMAENTDKLAAIAIPALAAGLTVKAVPAIWSTSIALNAATASAGGFTAAMIAAGRASMAFMATPLGAALTVAGAAAAYLAFRTDETAESVAQLTEKAKELNVQLSSKEAEQQAKKLIALEQELQGLMARKQSGAVDVFGVKENELRQRIADIQNLKQETSELKTQSEMLLLQERGMGTQLEMLNQQTRDFGVSVNDVNKLIWEQGAAVASIKKPMDEWDRAIDIISDDFKKLHEEAAQDLANPNKKSFDAAVDAQKEATERSKKLYEEQKQAAKKAAEEILQAKKRVQDEAYDHFEKNLQAQEKAQQDYQKSVSDTFDSVRRELDPTIDLYEAYNKKVQAVTASTLAGSADQEAMLKQLQENLNKQLDELLNKNEGTADAVRVAWEQSIRRLDDAFANVWEDIFSGASDFGSSLKRWFTSLLAELAHAAITKPIVIIMSGAMGIGGASSALASSGGAGGAFDIIGNIGSMYSGVTSMIGAGATYLGSMAAGAGSAQAAMLASQSAAFGLEGAALTTGALTGGTAATSVLSTMASAAPYVAAILAIDALTGGSISTGVFGGARGERTRALNIGIANGQVSDASNIYRATHYDAGWGRSGSWNVDNLGGAEFNQIIKDTVNSMAVSIRDNAERLGFEFNEGFSGQFDADLFGKTAEETQQIIADTFVRIGQSMVDSVSGLSDAMTPLQRSGEQTYETLARVVGQFDAFNYPVGRLNDSLATLSISTLSAVDSLVSMAGSMTNLQALQSGFVNAFYTDAQKAELTTQSVTRLFDAIGLSAPASREALVGLVQGLDLTTEAGQRAYLAITGATATLDQFYSAIERQPMTNITNSQVSIDYKQLVNDAFSSLKESVQVELDAVSKTYNARVSALSLETDAIKKNISALSTMRTALQSTYDTITASTSNPLIRYTSGQSTLQSILSSYRLGIAPVQSDIDRALRDVSVNDQAYYASFEDYSRDQAITSGIIAQIMALTDDSLSIEDRTLAAIDAQLNELKRQYDLDVSALNQTLDSYQQQVNAINGVNTSVLSVQEAIASLASAISGAMSASRAATAGSNIPSYAYDAYSVEDSPEVRQAKVEAQTGQVVSASDSAQLAAAKVLYQSVTGGANTAQYNAALDAIGGSFSNIGWDGSREGAAALVLKYGGSLPAFASGGDHLGGIRLVGENGPELEVTGPSRIFNAQQTHNILRGTNSDNSDALIAEIKALRAEVSALRDENKQLASSTLNESRKQARVLEKWDADGLPQAVAV